MTPLPDLDCMVIGAGVVGLATARALALAGHRVAVLEKEDGPGRHSSSRNSEVIHAGLYYPGNSLKARLCVTGRQALYHYCRERGIGHRRCGKLVVATEPNELEPLQALMRRGTDNGVDGLELLDAGATRRLAPRLRACAALLSPASGIIDSDAYLLSLKRDLADADGVLACHSHFLGARRINGGYRVRFRDGDGEHAVDTAMLVNAAGLHASHVAARIMPDAELTWPDTRYARGSYFVSSAPSPVDMLVYPLPSAHGLGIHLTVGVNGEARFGPDVEWVPTIDYRVCDARKPAFVRAIQRYLPDIKAASLTPGWAGIRAKAMVAGKPADDFIIQDATGHGFPGLVQLFGIESPGLTASLALADEVARRLTGKMPCCH